MSSRWKKVWADFWGNRSRTLLTILMIAVGTFAVGFNSNMGLYMNESMDSDYLSAQPSEAQVYAAALDDDMVAAAALVPGVNAIAGFSTLDARIVQPDGSFADIQFTAVKDPTTLTVNLLKPLQGELYLPVYADRETILDGAAASLGYQPGDMILLELENGKRRELRLIGYMHDVTGFPFNLTNRASAYVTPETLEWLGGSSTYNLLAVSVAEDPTDQKHVTEVAQAVANRLERAGAIVNFVSVYQPGHHFAYNITQGIFFVLGVLGYLTVLLSAFLIINTVTALMTQQTRQVGIMKATGGGTLQIFGMYLILITGIGIGALLIAVPLANQAAQFIGGYMADWLNFFPGVYRGYTATLTQQIFVAVVVPLLASVLPIYNSVRITVREALSDYGLGSNTKPKIETVNKNSIWIPRPMRLSLRNTFRRKTRLGLTLFTLVLAGAVFIGVYNLWASFGKVIDDVQGYFLSDINVVFSRAQRYDEVAEIAESLPGVDGTEGWLEYPATLISDVDGAGSQIVFVAPPSDSTLIDPIMTAGRWLTPADENAIVIGNHLLQRYPQLKIGDVLTIEANGKKSPWHIVGIYSITGNISPPLVYVNYEYLNRLIKQPGQIFSLRVITASHEVEFQKSVNDQLLALYETRGIPVSSTQLSAEFIAEQKAQTDILVYFMLIMASLIAIVGGLGLMGTMSINVLERTREIGIMRAIGASNADIQGIVIIEGLIIGLISWSVAILVAIPITSVLTQGVGLAILTAPMPAVYGISGIFAWLIFTLLLATIASTLPARRASQLTVRDTLAYE
jgi:putative ABC transport system permease protein